MTEVNAETPRRSRRWNGFVCPGCRCVFRVPSEHDGRGVVCPSCRRLLRLPAAGEATPSLTLGSGGMPVSGPEDGEGGSKERRRRRRRGDGQPRWESVRHRRKRTKSGGSLFWLWACVAVIGSFGALFGLMRLLGGSSVVVTPEVAGVGLPLEPAGELPATAGDSGGADAAAGVAAPVAHPEAAAGGDPAAILRQTEPLARQFLAARSVDELLPLVREPTATEAKIRGWIERHGPPTATLRRFADAGELAVAGRFVSVDVTLGDFTKRRLEFEQTADGFKVDWESWVGWSELPWREFRQQRPADPKLFRVTAKPGEYYNFGFADDRVWRCYKLASPDGSELLYGYAERGSALDMQIVPVAGGGPGAFVLRLRFPPDAPSDNQVFIDSLVAAGWVVGAGAAAGEP